MRKDDLIRLRHMLDAAREADAFSQHKTRSSLDTDRKLVLALVKCIEIIGEAAARFAMRMKSASVLMTKHALICLSVKRQCDPVSSKEKDLSRVGIVVE